MNASYVKVVCHVTGPEGQKKKMLTEISRKLKYLSQSQRFNPRIRGKFLISSHGVEICGSKFVVNDAWQVDAIDLGNHLDGY